MSARELAEAPRWIGPKDTAVVRYVSPRERALSSSERWVRAVAYALKEPGNHAAQRQVAPYLAAFVSRRSVLIPMPDSACSTAANLELARRVAALTGSPIRQAITRSECVRSQSAARAAHGRGHPPSAQRLIARRAARYLDPVCLDNVITTGSTVEAARLALGRCRGLAWASPHRFVFTAEEIAMVPPSPWHARRAAAAKRRGA